MLLLLLIGCPGGGKDTVTAPPTFADIQEQVFTPSCAFSSCHGSSAPAAQLDLSDGAAWAEIVGVESTDNPGQTLVVAGDPDASYLVTKCTEGAADIVGEPMPQGSSGLDAERLALLRDWITDGAQDN